jgi:hypothetical protein
MLKRIRYTGGLSRNSIEKFIFLHVKICQNKSLNTTYCLLIIEGCVNTTYFMLLAHYLSM